MIETGSHTLVGNTSGVHPGRIIRANKWEQARLDETRNHERFVSVLRRDNILPMREI